MSATLQDYMNELHELWKEENAFNKEDSPHWRRWYRLFLIKNNEGGSAWLGLSKDHELRTAIDEWDSYDFAALLGRMIVLPRELGNRSLLIDHNFRWVMTSIGLGNTTHKRGRPLAVGETEQRLIYTLWTIDYRTQEQLAQEFNIGIATVQRIIRKWKKRSEKP